MPIHITVKHIGDVLKEANEPLSINQIAARLDLHPQTIRKHMDTAIDNGYAVLTDMKDGKAFLYTAAGVKTSRYPMIQWGDDKREIRELFNEWGKKGLPDNRNAAIIAKIICKLYDYSNSFIYDRDNTEIDAAQKIAMMKELKQRLIQALKHYRDMVAICNSLLDAEVWTAKDVVKNLSLIDEDLSPEKINSILSNLDMIQSPANP